MLIQIRRKKKDFFFQEKKINKGEGTDEHF